MKNIIVIIIILLNWGVPCKAQLLEPQLVQIEFMDSTYKIVNLYAYTNDAIIVKRISLDSNNGRLDTLLYKAISKVNFLKVEHPRKNTFGVMLIGLVAGATIGWEYAEQKSSPTDLFDFRLVVATMFAAVGEAIGGTIGSIIDQNRMPISFNIHGEETHFKKFVSRYEDADFNTIENKKTDGGQYDINYMEQ